MGGVVDVLLVTPRSRSEVYQSLSKDLAAVEPPVWSLLLASFLRDKGVSVKILDAEALNLSHHDCARRIVDEGALLTVFVIYGQQPSASTQCMPAGREICAKVAEWAPELCTLVMGTHASALPRRTLMEEPYRFVCEGEGPYTVLGLVEALRDGSRTFGRVCGLWYRENGEPRRNAPADRIRDLDRELPDQAWDLVDMSLYRAHNWHCFDDLRNRKPYASLQTSLGCPYRCTFCCINAPFGGAGIRYWSPANVLSRVDVLVDRYGVRNIKIPDEMFVLNERHVLGICDGLIERGYDLNIWAYARVDTIKEKFLGKLRKAGFRWLALGIESGSKHVRDGVEKGRFGDTDIEDVVRRVRAAGIYVCANYIFGLPDDTYESMNSTLDLALRLNAEWSNFYSAMAYPGSPLFKLATDKGWPLPSDWSGYSQHAFDTLPLPTETLSGAEVLAFRDQAFQRYYTAESYLAMIRRTFGADVVDHLLEMTSLQIRRQHAPIPV